MKPNFTTSFLIVYLLYLQNSFANVKSYTISCSADKKTCITDKSMTKLTYSGGDGVIVPCICPGDNTRVIYYTCDKGTNTWTTVDVSKSTSEEIDQTIQKTNSVSNGCYACGKGNFLVGTKCYSCADETGYKGATTEEVAVAGIFSCIIPKGDTNEYSDDKGTFKYIAQCAFTCTNNNDALCKSNT
jgi:hypothetical protein